MQIVDRDRARAIFEMLGKPIGKPANRLVRRKRALPYRLERCDCGGRHVRERFAQMPYEREQIAVFTPQIEAHCGMRVSEQKIAKRDALAESGGRDDQRDRANRDARSSRSLMRARISRAVCMRSGGIRERRASRPFLEQAAVTPAWPAVKVALSQGCAGSVRYNANPYGYIFRRRRRRHGSGCVGYCAGAQFP